MKTIKMGCLNALALVLLASIPAMAGETFRWATTNVVGDAGYWNDPAMWTVTGTDDDGIPDADDTVQFGTIKEKQTIAKPVFDGAVYDCHRIAMALRTSAYVAFTLTFSNGGLRIGAGGVDISEGNQWQSASSFSGDFSIELTADQTWQHNGSNFYVSGPVSGPYQLTLTGAEGLDLRMLNSGNTFSGGLVQSSGRTVFSAASTVEDGALVKGPLGIGSLTLVGGILAATANVSVYNPVKFSGSRVTLGDSGKKITFAPDVSDSFVLFSDANDATRELVATADVEIQRTITEDGASGIAFVKSGAKTVTLAGTAANGYTGGTSVTQGKLVAKKDGALGTGDVTVTRSALDGTAALEISAGVVSAISDTAALRLDGYHGDDGDSLPTLTLGDGVVESVKALYLDGVAQDSGLTYGGPASAAAVKLDGWFAGTGMVRVSRPGMAVIVR